MAMHFRGRPRNRIVLSVDLGARRPDEPAAWGLRASAVGASRGGGVSGGEPRTRVTP